MATEHFININYICNEKCVFCAADVHQPQVSCADARSISADVVDRWLRESPPGPDDSVMLAGGEPTLAKELPRIIESIRKYCSRITLFTNGLRCASPEYAGSLIAAGLERFEIALFGSTAEKHDAVTQTPGSFERTLAALDVLSSMSDSHGVVVALRLLISRYTSSENAAILLVVHDRVPALKVVGLTRLILSQSASDADACISWAEAKPAVNEVASLARALGYTLAFEAMPLCIFEGDNAAFVATTMKSRMTRMTVNSDFRSPRMRYLDPFTIGTPSGKPPMRRAALPAVCMECDFQSVCGRVEAWYIRRYGTAGLASVKLQ